MAIKNIGSCPFAPSHIEGKKIRFVLGKIAFAY